MAELIDLPRVPSDPASTGKGGAPQSLMTGEPKADQKDDDTYRGTQMQRCEKVIGVCRSGT